MVISSNFSRKTVRKVDLRLAHLDAASRDKVIHDAEWRRQRDRLAAVTGTTDDSLLDWMIEQGFGPENLEALRYIPVAVVAWASGRVTEREEVIAMTPALTSELFHVPEASRTFQSWLSKKPSAELMSLWEHYTIDLLNRGDFAAEQQFGQQLYQLANRIALASGGLLNQGDICAGEQRVLNRIAKVYGLRDDDS